MWRRKEISVSSASVVDLKAELYKKQQEVAAERARSGSSYRKAVNLKPLKGLPPKNKGVEQRSAHDEAEELETNSSLETSWVALQRKAKIYEQMRKEGGGEDDHHGEESLVDFVRKSLVDQHPSDQDKEEEESSDDPWIEATDEFGRTRVIRKSQVPKLGLQFVNGKEEGAQGADDGSDHPTLVSEGMRFESERQQWEKEAVQSSATQHYDTRKEIRTLGVGFYSFSQNEDERARQMRELKEMRDDTLEGRVVAEKIKDAKKDKLEERRRLIKEKAAKRRKIVKEEATQGEDGGGDDDVGAFLSGIRRTVEEKS